MRPYLNYQNWEWVQEQEQMWESGCPRNTFSKEVLKKWKCVQDSRKILMWMHYPKQKIPALRPIKSNFSKMVLFPRVE